MTMKVKIKRTGEVYNIPDYKRVEVEACDSYGTPLSFSYDEVEFIQDETPKDIDWEQRRFELVKAALQGFCTNSSEKCVSIRDLVSWCIVASHDIIERIKTE